MVSYYRLSFLPEDIYEDAFAPYRHGHDLDHARSLNRLVQLHLRTGQLPGALSCALDAMRVDPYNRDAIKAIVHVHERQGNVTGAVSQLDDFIRSLGHDVGIVSDDELLALRDALNAKVAKSYHRDLVPAQERWSNDAQVVRQAGPERVSAAAAIGPAYL